MPSGVVLSQVKERPGMLQEVFNESLVEVDKAKKWLHLFLICRSRPLSDARNLDGVHCNRVVEDDHPEILNGSLLELVFIHLEIQFMLLQNLQDLLDDLSVH